MCSRLTNPRNFGVIFELHYHKLDFNVTPDSKVHGANMGPTGPSGPHVGHVNIANWVTLQLLAKQYRVSRDEDATAYNRLIFIVGIPAPTKTLFISEQVPWWV